MSRIRPSSLPALAECPRYTPDAGVDVGQKDDGTRRHEVFARCLKGDMAALNELTGDDREGVEWAVEYVKMHAPASEFELLTEHKVAFAGPHLEEVRGTADAVCGPVLFDLKWREDVSDYASQLAAYVLGRCMDFHRAGQLTPCIETHTLFAWRKHAERRTWTASEAAEIVDPIILAADDPESKPTTCGYCGWCSLRLTCQAIRDEVLPVLGATDFESITTAEALGEIRRRGELADEYGKAAKKWTNIMALKRGVVAEGYKIQTRQGNREVSSVVEAFPLSGLPQDVYLEACGVSLADLTKAYATFHGLTEKQAERDLSEKLKPVIVRKPSSSFLKEA